MAIEFDPDKDAANIAKHGISLARAADLAVLKVIRSDRHGEVRSQAFGVIDGEFYSLAFTVRRRKVRAISLRRANAREVALYLTTLP